MGYIEGFEHNMFFRLFAESLPLGFEHISNGIPLKEQWVEENSHLISSIMLLSTFSYIEGILNSAWIDDFGGDFQPELDSLRIVRNAITHNDGSIESNWKARGLTGSEQLALVEKFMELLQANDYLPLHTWSPEKRADYISIDEGIVKLGESSIGRIGSIGHNILRRAGKIIYD